MHYEYCPVDPERFATNLRRDTVSGNLIWDNSSGQEVLIIQTPYGQSPVPGMEEICRALEGADLKQDGFTEVLSGIRVRFVSAAEKAKRMGWPIKGEASTYTIFSVTKDGEACKIFATGNHSMISAFCHIPVEMRISVLEMTRMSGFFKKKESPTGFYCITFPVGPGNDYKDGDLCYKINHFQIPVTKKMLERRYVYVKTNTKPELVSHNKGIKII